MRRRRSWREVPAGLLAAAAPLLSLMVGACAVIDIGASQPESAKFDWFEYQGHDPVFEAHKAGPGEYLNPILSGFYPDPSVTRAGDDYYLVTSTFTYFPGIPVFKSHDLVHWTQIGNVIDRPNQLKFDGLGISRGVFAPAISFHDGMFYLVNTCVDCGGNYLVTAKDAAGPWSDPIWLGFDGIDPSLFFDGDGKAYIVNNGPPEGTPLYDGHRALWLQEIDLAAKKMVGPRTMIVNGGTDLKKHPVWIEAPHIFRYEGKYYLNAAEGGTAEQHSEVIFRADSLRGPWTPFKGNPILTQRTLDPSRPDPVTSTGHAEFVQAPNGNWWAVFLGTRPYKDNFYNTGRETFLMPIAWDKGWPFVTTDAMPYVHADPASAAQPSLVATAGNFALRDEFDEDRLPFYWNFIRVPTERWWSLRDNPGRLTVRARPQAIGGGVQPSFVGRRLQNAYATVSTAMEFKPRKDGSAAGLVAFQNDGYFYFLGLVREGGKTLVEVRRRAGEKSADFGSIVASATVKTGSKSRTDLRIDLRGDKIDFAYATRAGEWTALLKDADATILSTKTAGGFVGTQIGMYAYTPAP